jgi:tetratricopeptide (TPR) repeat protein
VTAGMQWYERLALLEDAKHRAERAEEEGALYGPLLLDALAGTWRRTMRSDPHYRSYGTLMFLLGKAREKFSTEPTTAYEITSAVLDFVDDVEDAPSHIAAKGIRGLAWKEHANAALQRGTVTEALAAAERSMEIYGSEAGLVFDHTRARLVVCKVLRELGEVTRAMEIARECTVIFNDYGDLTSANMARWFEAGVLFSSKRFSEALEIFMNVTEQAELDGDKTTVAKCLLAGAECARELGDLSSARDLYPRALTLYEELNIRDGANRVRWGYALTLAAEGKMHAAISELFMVRAVFLTLGMNSVAACASLDIVRLRFDSGADVRALCTELVTTFTAAGMAQNAIEALAYLREQAKSETLTTGKIARLRTYFDELSNKPTLLFARPLEEEA